jgi:hypothetical protein
MFFPLSGLLVILTLKMHIDKLTGLVVDLCIKIHSSVGPGCFEKVYEELLYYELVKRE